MTRTRNFQKIQAYGMYPSPLDRLRIVPHLGSIALTDRVLDHVLSLFRIQSPRSPLPRHQRADPRPLLEQIGN
jgi:hypothetical protein